MLREEKTDGLERIYCDDELICLILKSSYKKDCVHFFTPDNFSQQVGYLSHKKGNIVKPHKHKLHKREVLYTQEVLLIKQGQAKISLYDNERKFLCSRVLEEGDLILLCAGGHGLEMLKDSVMIEIKQGPYKGQEDKEIFSEVD